MGNAFIGVAYFLDGLQLLSKRGLRRFVIIPALINIFLFIGLFFILNHFVREFNAWLVNFLPSWLGFLAVILWVLFLISFILFFIYTFVIIANILAAPFNSLLAEKVELYLTGRAAPDQSWSSLLRDVPRVIFRQFAILGYYLPRLFLILILFFIPVVQVIAPVLWFLFNAWFLTMTYIDYPTDNHKIPVSQVREWLTQRRLTSWGFGISVLIATMIPILNFLSIPAAVAGATKFWLNEKNK